MLFPGPGNYGPRNQVLQTPVYAGMAFVSEPLWNNPHEKVQGDPNQDEYMKYVEEAIALRDNLAAATGYDNSGGTSQSAKTGGFQP